MNHTIAYTRHSQEPDSRSLTGFWYFHPANRTWFVAPAFEILLQPGWLFVKAAFILSNSYPIREFSNFMRRFSERVDFQYYPPKGLGKKITRI